MHVGGLTANWTDEPNDASILGCAGIDLELVAVAPNTPDNEMHVESLLCLTPRLTRRRQRRRERLSNLLKTRIAAFAGVGLNRLLGLVAIEGSEIIFV